MSLLSNVKSVVDEWVRPYEVGSFIVVPTFTLYPSNSFVQVYVEGGESSFVVSDGGGALDVLVGAGGGGSVGKKHLSEVAGRYQLKVNRSGWIHSARVDRSMLPAMVGLVAECSKAAAELLLRLFRPERHPDFRKDLERLLGQTYAAGLERRAKFPGASNKFHTFDYAIKLDGGPTVVIDAVVPDANSINSAIVSHIDLKHAHRPDTAQRIVYDDRVPWRSADLALLEVGATVVGFNALPHSLTRLRGPAGRHLAAN